MTNTTNTTNNTNTTKALATNIEWIAMGDLKAGDVVCDMNIKVRLIGEPRRFERNGRACTNWATELVQYEEGPIWRSHAEDWGMQSTDSVEWPVDRDPRLY
jgi:hypothetical protein